MAHLRPERPGASGAKSGKRQHPFRAQDASYPHCLQIAAHTTAAGGGGSAPGDGGLVTVPGIDPGFCQPGCTSRKSHVAGKLGAGPVEVEIRPAAGPALPLNHDTGTVLGPPTATRAPPSMA